MKSYEIPHEKIVMSALFFFDVQLQFPDERQRK